MAKDSKVWDCIIIGSGACGLSAAINAASEGLSILVIDRATIPGGLIGTTSLIENYPGFPDGIEGRVLTNRMVEQAMKFGAEFMMNTCVHGIEKEEDLFVLSIETLYHKIEDREILGISAHCVIVASGRNHKKLDLNNEQDLLESDKLRYGHPETHQPIKGHILVIGGGNSAGQAATWLTKQACSVTIVAPRLDAMSQYLIDRIKSPKSYVNLIIGRVIAIQQTSGDILITSKDKEGLYHTVSADKVYCLIGLEVDDVFKDMKNEEGFLIDTIDGIFVAGDCRNSSEKRCTAAVGEGVKAVSEVHKYLKEKKLSFVN